MRTTECRIDKKKKRTRMIIWSIVIAVLCIGLIVAAWFVNRMLRHPEDMFQTDITEAVPHATIVPPAFPISTEETNDWETTTPAEVEDPGNAGVSSNILNIMLTGIDAYEDGKTTSGTMPHTDSIMVISVNFDINTVELITLPRDTLTTVPGHSGFYKLNAVFNVGLEGEFKTTGKAEDLAEGFNLLCRTAERWLGGISIPYYYGLDFQAVADIVDAIGGIDYDVDQAFTAMRSKRSYNVGMHHLDGDAVMGYLRIRWNADGLDSSRTARQRRMMVAIFRKLKTEGKLSQIPALISAANSGIYTNTSLTQTTALVNYAANLDPDEIRTSAMFGEIGKIEYDWRFVYVNQQNRIDLIKRVYGIDAKPVGVCTRQYERWLHSIGFVTIKRLHQIETVLSVIEEKKTAGETFTDEQIAFYENCYLDYLNLYRAYAAYSNELADNYAVTPWREDKSNQSVWSSEEKQRNKELTAREAEIREALIDLSTEARASLAELAKSIGYKRISWSISGNWYKDTDINEVYVNFG